MGFSSLEKPIKFRTEYKNNSENEKTAPFTATTDQFSIVIYKRMSTITKLTSEKGIAMLGYEGFIYTLERQSETKMIFRCKNRDCKGRCHTNPSMDVIVSGPTEHCHAPNPGYVSVVELKKKIESRAVDGEESPSVISHSALGFFP